MRRPYLKYQGPRITDDGYPVRRAVLITADPPGPHRHWSNLRFFRGTARRILRELRGKKR